MKLKLHFDHSPLPSITLNITTIEFLLKFKKFNQHNYRIDTYSSNHRFPKKSSNFVQNDNADTISARKSIYAHVLFRNINRQNLHFFNLMKLVRTQQQRRRRNHDLGFTANQERELSPPVAPTNLCSQRMKRRAHRHSGEALRKWRIISLPGLENRLLLDFAHHGTSIREAQTSAVHTSTTPNSKSFR
ncbi:hypothetical protein [Paraburkholderia bannensis]|uniref:hypothetical protein n=1 Tax=Paraburkholderia bannensis TaxID=765414 RepID=UPI002AC35520|nr:hypothetical protein [Paraburkholderia bannensis]